MILWLLVCAFYIPQLLTGTIQFDGLDVHYSAQRYLSDELYAGRLPFWTPFIFSGFPFLADLQVGAWYPLNWPFYFAGTKPGSIAVELLLHTLIACGGAYALGMRLLGSPVGAFGAALFYGLSGFFAAHSQHVGIFQTAAWLPWLVLLLSSIRERLTPCRLALAGLLGAALALPGHFQTALYALCGATLWALLESALDRSRAQAARVTLGLLAVGVWGGLIAAVMILPALELVGQSVRMQLDARGLDLGYFHPAALFTLVAPDYYGLLSSHYRGPGDSTQHYFYAGVALVPLAVLGLANRPVVRVAALLGLPFLWYALGPTGGLFGLVARLPGFKQVELPMHGWFLPALGLALLGGAGLRRVPGRLRGPLLGVVFVDVLFFNQVQLPLAFARGSFDQLYGPALRAFSTQVLTSQPAVERVYGQPLSAISYRNHALQSRVETTYGYNPLELAGYAAYADAAALNPRLVDGLAASHRLVEGSPVLEPHATAMPMAYFARRVSVQADEADVRRSLVNLEPAVETLVVGPAPLGLEVTPDARATATIVQRSSDALTIRYRSTTAGLLRLAIPAYPGWRASLNNHSTDLTTLTVDGALLGVVTPPGAGDVHLQFEPTLFWPGATVSILALGACVASLGLQARHNAVRGKYPPTGVRPARGHRGSRDQ